MFFSLLFLLGLLARFIMFVRASTPATTVASFFRTATVQHFLASLLYSSLVLSNRTWYLSSRNFIDSARQDRKIHPPET